jgi:hypothetical protein
MNWIKKGLVYGPDQRMPWANHSALTPTPIRKDETTIRVFAGFRDLAGVSRIGYVDLQADNPSIIKGISKTPVLDIGDPGTFDDNGVILGDVIRIGDVVRMYYVGFQLVEKVKFLAFSGLAESHDGGDTFTRVCRAPILDRSDEGLYFNAIHSVLVEGGLWKVWGGVGNEWEKLKDGAYPRYTTRYYESPDGLNFPKTGTACFDYKFNEYRIGRPRVYKKDDIYQMFFTVGTKDKGYFPGYAESVDGKSWQRMDHKIGIGLSETGWDSGMLCYPSLIDYQNRTYMFYNGNNYGYDGFGYAELSQEKGD